MSESLEYRIAKLELQPDDVLVLKFDRILSQGDATNVRSQLKEILPRGTKSMILDRDGTVSVLTADEIERRVSTQS